MPSPEAQLASNDQVPTSASGSITKPSAAISATLVELASSVVAGGVHAASSTQAAARAGRMGKPPGGDSTTRRVGAQAYIEGVGLRFGSERRIAPIMNMAGPI